MQENITEKQQEALFKRLCSRDENSICADCRSKGATWVSLGYGVFVCINCSGVHRSFGMHITRVRSTKLDSWTIADSKIMETIGNETANAYWEFGLSDKPNRTPVRDEDRASFIRQKYITKLWVKPAVQDPLTVLLDNYAIKIDELRAMYTGGDSKSPLANKPVKRKAEPSKLHASPHHTSKSIPITHSHHIEEELMCFDDISKPTNTAPLQAPSWSFNGKSHSTPSQPHDPFSYNFGLGSHHPAPQSKQEAKKDPFDFQLHNFSQPQTDTNKGNAQNVTTQKSGNTGDDIFDFTKPAQPNANLNTQNKQTGQWDYLGTSGTNQTAPRGQQNFSSTHTPLNAFPDDKYAVLDMYKLNYHNAGFKY